MTNLRIHQPAIGRRWMAVISLSFIIFHLSFSRVAAQTQVEYWFDQDPGMGKGIPVSSTLDADGNLVFLAPTSHLPSGNHLMGVRTIGTDTIGRPCYGPTLLQTVGVQRPQDQGVFSRIEYFWDNDPGYGRGAPIAFTPGTEVNVNDFYVSTVGITSGNHKLFVRAFGGFGWTPLLCQDVAVQHAADAGRIIRLEYFWDDDPGRGLGKPIAIVADSELSLDNLEISTEGLTPGAHILGIRPYGGAGWGPTISQEVVVTGGTLTVDFVEYFWDSDPGLGKANVLPIEANKEMNLENVVFSTADLSPGLHQLGIRARGGLSWGPTVYLETYVPLRATDAIVTNGEYFWDEDRGYGTGTPLSITPGQEVNVDALGLSTEGLSAGHHQLFMRYRGPMGWSPTLCNDVIVMPETKVLNAEYFWNEDLGYGKGTPISFDPAQEVTFENLGISTTEVHGDALFFIRYRGPFGWSPTMCYQVLVDAEGNYTLNALAETSIETRNYESLTDAFADFADRGVGNDITLTLPTSNTDYAFDATTAESLEQVTAISESIARVSTDREGKSIGFKATEGSGNTLIVSTTDEGLPAVLNLFAHTWLENVTLTINGTSYDFSSWAQAPRFQEACSEEETQPVSIAGSIGTGSMKVSFTPQPLQGSALSGFPAEATASLPAMTLINSGSTTEALPYHVALLDEGNNELAAYTYSIYVRPRVGSQTFSGLSPANGSSLDPVATTLRWNAVPGAESYRLTITDITGDAPVTVLDGSPVKATTYTLTVESGKRYSWQVTAIGPCDELSGPVMTLEGRLLPDLVVSSITMPEAAEAGNQLTVTATIANQGEGATTENQWTDRLYYTIDSQDFAQAVQIAELPHTGNITAGASYDVTFTITAPQVESGTLRVFVETDVTAKVMETSDDNNRTLSPTSADLRPFYMNTADLAALRQLYTAFGGTEWNGTPWNTASELIQPGNWSGVTFDTEGCVTAINLQGRGLTGSLSVAVPYIATLSQLKTLNLSRNTLTGDPALFLQGAGSQLTALNLSYNQIDELSVPLSASIQSLALDHQTINETLTFNLSSPFDESFMANLPRVLLYDHASASFGTEIALKCSYAGWSCKMTNDNGEVQYNLLSTDNVYQGPVDVVLPVSVLSGDASGSTLSMTLSYPQGDANFDGETEILDLQTIINYMYGEYKNRIFNYTAANLQPDNRINIQDMVHLIDMLLNRTDDDVQGNVRTSSVCKTPSMVKADASATLTIDNGKLLLTTTVPVAALDIIIDGCRNVLVDEEMTSTGITSTMRLEDNKIHLLAYSLAGATLPVGTTTLCRFDEETPQLAYYRLAASDANAIETSIKSTGITTSMNEPITATTCFRLYTLSGILVVQGQLGQLEDMLLRQKKGTYIMRVTTSDGSIDTKRIRIE